MTRGTFLLRQGGLGLLLAILALTSQLALGAMVVPYQDGAASTARLDEVAVLCRGGLAPHRPAAPHRHAPDHALCPLSVSLALPAALPASAVPVPRRAGASLTNAWARPAPTGPPAAYASARFARGPPTLT